MLLTLSACSSESPEQESAPNPTDGTSSSYPIAEELADPREAAVAAYERYWRTVAEATSIPDPALPALAEVSSGAALATAQELAQAALDAGERDTGAPIHDAAVTSAYPEDSPTEFGITDCSDSSDWVTVDADTGEPVPGEEYGKREIQALVVHAEGRWLVTEVAVQELDSC